MDDKKYTLVLDAGKDSAKIMGGENTVLKEDINSSQKFIFKSRTYDLKSGYIETQGNTNKIEFDGKELLVGEQGTDRSLKSSKTNELHQICAYNAITKYLESETTGNIINLVLACPVPVLSSDTDKEEYRKLIKGDGPIKITVDDKNYEFTIENILMKAEGSGVLYLIPESFKNKKVLVVDFGGLNMTVTLFTNGTCVNPTSDRFAEEHGSVALINEISKALTTYRNGNIVQYKTAEEALERGYLLQYGDKDSKSIEYIDKAKNIFFNNALKIIELHSIDIADIDQVMFIGGTSEYLDKQIGTLKNSFVTDDPQWSSVEGLFKVALKKYIG